MKEVGIEIRNSRPNSCALRVKENYIIWGFWYQTPTIMHYTRKCLLEIFMVMLFPWLAMPRYQHLSKNGIRNYCVFIHLNVLIYIKNSLSLLYYLLDLKGEELMKCQNLVRHVSKTYLLNYLFCHCNDDIWKSLYWDQRTDFSSQQSICGKSKLLTIIYIQYTLSQLEK